jgi:hypothetical protein
LLYASGSLTNTGTSLLSVIKEYGDIGVGRDDNPTLLESRQALPARNVRMSASSPFKPRYAAVEAEAAHEKRK